jgi:hypothetical protein
VGVTRVTNRDMPRSVGDIDGFVRLIQVACEDEVVGARLESILSMPADKRRSFLHGLINDMSMGQVPAPLLEALACLTDDAVAERAFEVVSGRRRLP